MSEIRGWITRRFLQALWPILIKSIGNYVEPQHQQNPASKEAVMAFQHAEKVQQANFTKQFTKEVTSTPLGPEPLLLSKISLKPAGNNYQMLGMYPTKGQGIELAMNDTLLHSLCKLLIDAHRVAEWKLDLTIPGTDKLSPMQGSEGKLN